MMTLTIPRETERRTDAEAGPERRRGLRVKQQRPVKVYEMASTRYFGGQTEDVSVTGLRVELPAWVPVRPGGLLLVHVGQNRGGVPLANRKRMIPTRVVWVKRDAESRGGVMTAGLEFSVSIEARLDAA
jgi:hypothetical protein